MFKPDMQGINSFLAREQAAKGMATHTSKVNPAMWTYQKLASAIKDFEDNLDEAEEVGGRLVTFGSEVSFHIESFGYYGPEMITFHGTLATGEAVSLVQHYTQLNVLFVAMKKPDNQPQARRIGFYIDDEDES